MAIFYHLSESIADSILSIRASILWTELEQFGCKMGKIHNRKTGQKLATVTKVLKTNWLDRFYFYGWFRFLRFLAVLQIGYQRFHSRVFRFPFFCSGIPLESPISKCRHCSCFWAHRYEILFWISKTIKLKSDLSTNDYNLGLI